MTGLDNISRNMTSYFNKLGAVKQLTFLDRDFFYNEMKAHIEEFKIPAKKREGEPEILTEEDIFNSDEI